MLLQVPFPQALFLLTITYVRRTPLLFGPSCAPHLGSCISISCSSYHMYKWMYWRGACIYNLTDYLHRATSHSKVGWQVVPADLCCKLLLQRVMSPLDRSLALRVPRATADQLHARMPNLQQTLDYLVRETWVLKSSVTFTALLLTEAWASLN